MDITAHRLAETALRCSRAGYRALTESSLQGIVILDAEDCIVYANTALANILGYEVAHEIVGQALCDYISVRNLARIRHHCQTQRQGDSIPSRYEVQGTKRDGSVCWLQIRYAPFEWAGQIVRMSTVVDVSERRELQQTLINLSEREQRRLGRELHDGLGQLFTGAALESHRLARHLAKQNHPEAAAAARVLEWMNQALGALHDMAHGLDPELLVNQGLGEALKSIAVQAERLSDFTCKVEVDIPEGLIASSDALHLYRIAQEAVTNAVKHSQATRVELQAKVIADRLQLRVRDNGVGIPDQLDSGVRMGLRNMHTRAALLDATLDIQRLSEGGAEIVCSVPLDRSE